MAQRSTTTGRQQEFSATTKDDLIATARALFTEHGYAETSLDSIVAGARVTKGALYHHFDGKKALFLAVHHAIDEDAVRRIGAAVDQESDPWMAATEGLYAFLEIAREPEYRRIIIQDGHSILGFEERQETERTTFGTVHELVRATMATGAWQLPEAMVDTFSRIIFGAMSSAGAAVATSADPDTETIRVGASVSLLISAMRHMSTQHGSMEDVVTRIAASDPVVTKIDAVLAGLAVPGSAINANERAVLSVLMADALDLADSVADLLLAEGAHQIAQGRPERAAAAMGVADKQAMPIETQVGRTPRGGASYTQRVVVLCPAPVQGWPEDRRSEAEPAVNAWLATMLGKPDAYHFSARVHRNDAHGVDTIDAEPVVVEWRELGLSPLSAVWLAGNASSTRIAPAGETGFRSLVAAALVGKIVDPQAVTGLDIDSAAGNTLGLAAFEAIAMTLRNLLDKSRFATRKDLVHVDSAIEESLAMGEYPGVDVAELEARAGKLLDAFDAISASLLASANADALLAGLTAADDMVSSATWPAQVFAIDASGADPATREQRATDAIAALEPVLLARRDAVHAGPKLLDGQLTPTDAQRAQHAIEQIKRLLGKDFPVLPRFAIGPYATEFNASLADQDALTTSDAWRVNGWLAQVARVRDGVDRFAGALSAHEALSAPLESGDLKVVQYPHHDGRVWAALPEAWQEDAAAVFAPATVPEELRDYLGAQPGAPYRDINRVAPNLAITLHAPGLAAIAAEETLAVFVCDEWPEFIPDPFQTAAISFQYDAPGARPPQVILLALPPTLQQAAWSFDDAVDVINEALDLAKLRGVCPKDLGSGLGALLPGNFLPHTYTDDLPSVKVLQMMRAARQRVETFAGNRTDTFVLGKI